MGVKVRKSGGIFPFCGALMLTACTLVPQESHAFGADNLFYGFIANGNQSLYMQAVSDTNDSVALEKQGKGARNFVDSMAVRAIDFLEDADMDNAAKRAAFKKLLQDSFDMSTIGRFTLGRYWRVSTPQERNEYQKLFEKMVVNVYSERFSEYKGQKFETRSFRPDGTKDTIVTSFIVPDQGSEIQIDWRVRYKNGKYQIIDVIVEGVSMSVTQRSDFSSVIQRGGGNVQVLLNHLRDKTE